MRSSKLIRKSLVDIINFGYRSYRKNSYVLKLSGSENHIQQV